MPYFMCAHNKVAMLVNKPIYKGSEVSCKAHRCLLQALQLVFTFIGSVKKLNNRSVPYIPIFQPARSPRMACFV